MHHTLSRSLILSAGCCAFLLLTACTGYGTGSGSSSGIPRAGTLFRSSSSSMSRSSSGPRFSNFLSSASSSVAPAPFFSLRHSSSASSLPFASSVSSVAAIGTGTPAVAGDAVKIFVEADRGEARPGDTIYYTVTVKNLSAASLQNFAVSYSYAPGQVSVQEADGAVYPDRIEWTVDQLQPGQKRGLRVRVQVAQGLPGGTAVRGAALATVNGTAVSYQSPDVFVLESLPATGAGDFTGPLEDTTRFVKPL